MKKTKDRLSADQRSYCMSRVRGKNTSLEKVAFTELRKNGVRFKKHSKALAGKPDIVLTDRKVAVFVDGDFWHGYRFPTWSRNLAPFWREKIEKNRKRDRSNFRKLRAAGWRVVRIWGHEIKRDPSVIMTRLALPGE